MSASDARQSETLVIGLSGPSSSGKTTLARLLRGVFNIEASPDTNGFSIKLFILHEDDFYKPDKEIPLREVSSSAHGTRTVQDWDCVESLNLATLDSAIRHIKQHGAIPANLSSKEDQNSVGDVGVSDDQVNALKDQVASWLKRHTAANDESTAVKHVTICILDGFLLFPPSPVLLGTTATTEDSGGIDPSSIPLLAALYSTLKDTLDLKVFLPSTRQRTVERRANRSGYVTMEGFWQDPPGYVEDVVWANYKRDHMWLFKSAEDADVGNVDREGEWIGKEEIVVGPGSGDVSMREVLDFGVDVLKDKIQSLLRLKGEQVAVADEANL